MPAAEVILRLQNQASPALQRTATDAQTLAAAESRAALAAGDLTGALRAMDTAIGAVSGQTKSGTAETLAMARSEATAAAAVGDHASAITVLQAELATQTERTRGVIAAEAQLNALSIREADTAIRVAQAQARASVATKDYAGALEVLNAAKAANADGSALAVASLETQIAQTEVAGTATGALTAQLGHLLSPLALVTAAAAAGVAVFKSFGDALAFEGQLTQDRAAFDGVYGSILHGNVVLDAAIARGRAFGFTQEETGTAFRELAPIIRESTASTEEQIGALARFSVLHPEDAVNQLKTAVEGLQSGGRITGIAKDLGLTTDEQERLKTAVANGKDVFVALNEVLDRHGVTLQTAAERMDGYAGAEKRAALASEDLKQAQASFAQGPGIVLIEEQTRLVTGLSRVLGGSGGLAAAFQAIGQANQQSNTYQQVYNQSLESGATDAEADRAALAAVKQEQDALILVTQAATTQVLRAADADDRLAGGALNAAGGVTALTAALAGVANAPLPHLDDRAAGAVGGLGGLLTKGFEGVADASHAADQAQVQLLDSEIALAAAKKDTGREIDLLRQKQAQYARGTAEFNQIEAQIIGVQTSGGKTRVSAAASTALQLQNVEENSQAAILKAQREGQERLRDQQQDFDLRRSRSQEDEDRKIASLLAHGQKAAAVREQEDFARQQRRAQEDANIQRQRTLRNNAESTGDITGGAARRSDQIGDRAALRGVTPSASGGGGASLPSLPSARGAGASAQPIAQINLLLDGKVFAAAIWVPLEPIVDQELALALTQSGVPNAGQQSVGGAG